MHLYQFKLVCRCPNDESVNIYDVEINSDYKRFLDLFKKIDFNLEYVWKLDESELDEMKYLQRENRYLTIK